MVLRSQQDRLPDLALVAQPAPVAPLQTIIEGAVVAVVVAADRVPVAAEPNSKPQLIPITTENARVKSPGVSLSRKTPTVIPGDQRDRGTRGCAFFSEA